MTSSANSLLEVLDEFRTYVFVPGLTQIIFAELIRGSPWIIASSKTGQIKSARTSVVLYRTKVLMMYAYCYANYDAVVITVVNIVQEIEDQVIARKQNRLLEPAQAEGALE